MDKLSLTVEQSANVVIITNLDAEIEYVNARFLEATGYSREEVTGQNPRVLKSGITPERTYIELWDALTNGKTWQGEFANRRKDGSEFYEAALIMPLRGRDGKITHYVAIKEDITEKNVTKKSCAAIVCIWKNWWKPERRNWNTPSARPKPPTNRKALFWPI